jgi:hypothetical protein
MSSEQAALDLAPTVIDGAPAAAKTAKAPEKFTYALPAFTVQRRKSGWWISPSKIAIASASPLKGAFVNAHRRLCSAA